MDQISTRVFIVDDHQVVREGVRWTLESAGGFEVVGEAGTFSEGLRGISRCAPDVAVVDVRLPGGDGVQLVREVRSRDPRTRCLMLTAFPEEEAFVQSIVAGAAGYVGKDVTPDQLLAAVRAVAAGRSVLKWDEMVTLRERARGMPADDEFLAELTEQERRILDLVAEGLTNREIAQRLFLAEKTVRNYVSSVLAKLGMKNRTQVAAYVARAAVRPKHHSVRLPR